MNRLHQLLPTHTHTHTKESKPQGHPTKPTAADVFCDYKVLPAVVGKYDAELLQDFVKLGGLLRLQGPVPLAGWWVDGDLGGLSSLDLCGPPGLGLRGPTWQWFRPMLALSQGDVVALSERKLLDG